MMRYSVCFSNYLFSDLKIKHREELGGDSLRDVLKNGVKQCEAYAKEYEVIAKALKKIAIIAKAEPSIKVSWKGSGVFDIIYPKGNKKLEAILKRMAKAGFIWEFKDV